ncbi:MAG TPA: ABC transporter ATP-binding protein [Candidatus Methanoperedens sp.]|nr:ABC transporter ATP-binding protein [Candidatus Methanoperedens sp.]
MISAEAVTVRFGRGFARKPLVALDGFSLEIAAGDIFALLGPNGAGKSTAMYCFLGLIQPDGGRVSVFGERPRPGAEVFDRVAYLPEEPHYHLYLTVREAVRYYSRLYRRPATEAVIDDALSRVGLAEFRDLKLSKCSKGMKQKAGIACCLVSAPDLVLLDEPTRGLDPIIVKEFRGILAEMHRKGATIVLNSHVLSEVESLCSRAAIINRGKVIARDALADLRQYDRHTYAVECDQTEAVSEFLAVESRENGRIRGVLPAERFAEFAVFCRERGLTVYECSLKRRSLEDAFISILKEND